MIGTCRLCQTPNSDLQASHIVPRWAYKRARGNGKNPNPVVISRTRAVQISDQMTEFPPNARCIVAFHDLPMNGDTHLASICTTPLTERQSGFFIHRFIIFGLAYYFSVGQAEPAWMNGLCLNSTPRLVMLAPQDLLIDWVGPWMARARAVGSLARTRPQVRR
jgi:hypothetical protein